MSRNEIPAAQLESWRTPSDALVFAAPRQVQLFGGPWMPRHISGDALLLEFRSGWMYEEPDSQEVREAPGFVLLACRRMAVYHGWGNL